METTISVKYDMKPITLNSPKHLNLIVDKNKHTCIVLKHTERLKLTKLGFKASIIHEFQGAS